MIDLGTIAGLHAHRHELHAYCLGCDRWSALPLETFIASGLGDRRLPLAVRCVRCGALGQLQVRPPMPQCTACGWVAPPSG